MSGSIWDALDALTKPFPPLSSLSSSPLQPLTGWFCCVAVAASRSVQPSPPCSLQLHLLARGLFCLDDMTVPAAIHALVLLSRICSLASVACQFQGCPTPALLSGQLMPCPYFCFPLCTASYAFLVHAKVCLLTTTFYLSFGLLVFAAAFPCCNSPFHPAQLLALHCAWPRTACASQTFAFTHSTDPPFPPAFWLFLSQCAPPGCSCFSLGRALPSSLQPALCVVLTAALS